MIYCQRTDLVSPRSSAVTCVPGLGRSERPPAGASDLDAGDLKFAPALDNTLGPSAREPFPEQLGNQWFVEAVCRHHDFATAASAAGEQFERVAMGGGESDLGGHTDIVAGQSSIRKERAGTKINRPPERPAV